MSEPDSVDMERLEHVSRVVDALYDGLIGKLIAHLKELPDNCRQSGDDSMLKDVWEEFKYQVQREEFAMFEFYEATIQDICARMVAALDWDRQQLLWLWSEGYYRWTEDEIPWGEIANGHVADELYDRLYSAASNEDLAIDPDAERDQESNEEDKRLYDLLSEPHEDNPDRDAAEDDPTSGPKN